MSNETTRQARARGEAVKLLAARFGADTDHAMPRAELKLTDNAGRERVARNDAAWATANATVDAWVGAGYTNSEALVHIEAGALHPGDERHPDRLASAPKKKAKK
jgi:hypothetical protein